MHEMILLWGKKLRVRENFYLYIKGGQKTILSQVGFSRRWSLGHRVSITDQHLGAEGKFKYSAGWPSPWGALKQIWAPPLYSHLNQWLAATTQKGVPLGKDVLCHWGTPEVADSPATSPSSGFLPSSVHHIKHENEVFLLFPWLTLREYLLVYLPEREEVNIKKRFQKHVDSIL